MRVCINTWGLYNEGLHLGTWCDIENYEDVIEELKEIHEDNDLGDDLEVYCADWEDDDLEICREHSDLEELRETYEKYAELDDWERDIISYLTSVHSCDFNEAYEKKDDVIYYDYASFSDLAYDFVEKGLYGEVPDCIKYYLDYEHIGRDLEYDYDLYNGKIYRFD